MQEDLTYKASGRTMPEVQLIVSLTDDFTMLTLTVLVATIDALGHFETG